MPPLHSFDPGELVGPVFMLRQGLDEESGKVFQSVTVRHFIDDKMKREIEKATYNLSDDVLPEVIPLNQNGISFMLAFPCDVDVDTIPTMVEMIMTELEVRLARHAHIAANPGIGRVVYAEVEKH